MKRRNLILGLGSVSLAGASVFGSGAFSSVQADRDVTVNVAGDDEAYLALEPAEGPNGDYASIEDGTLALNFDGSAEGVDGQGFNAEATTRVDEVFTITNQGTQTVGVYIEEFETTADGVDVAFLEQESDPETSIVGPESAVELPVGEPVPVGVVVNARGSGPVSGVIEDDTITIVAIVEEEDAPPGDEEPETTFEVFDETDDELFEFTIEPDGSVSGVDPVNLEFDEPLAEGLTSEDVTLRNNTGDNEAPGNRRRLLIRQYSGSTASVDVQGTIEVGEESVVIDGTAGGVELGEDPPTPDEVTLVRDGDDKIVEDGLDSKFVDSQRLRVTGYSPDEQFDLDKVELHYPEAADFNDTDNGDFNLTREPATGIRQPLRVNNDTYEENEVALNVDQSPRNNKTFRPDQVYTIEIAINTNEVNVEDIETNDVTLELKDTNGETVEEFSTN